MPCAILHGVAGELRAPSAQGGGLVFLSARLHVALAAGSLLLCGCWVCLRPPTTLRGCGAVLSAALLVAAVCGRHRKCRRLRRWR